MTETQLDEHSKTEEIKAFLNPFSLYANNVAEHVYSNTAVAYKEGIEILGSRMLPGITRITLNHYGVDFPINMILLYRQQNLENDHFLYMVQHLMGNDNNVHIILGDFNKNYLTEESDFLRTRLQDYDMIVQEPTHISGSLIDHVYIHKELKTVFEITSSIHSIYYSDHEAVQIIFKKVNR